MRRPGCLARTRGALLLEMLLALALGVVVLASFAGALAASLRWARSIVGRAEAIEVVRTIWVVLDEELRPGTPGRDWAVSGERTVALRAFRGVARVCGAGGAPDRWVVAYRGRRLPDAARGDSLLVLGADGGWRAFSLARSDPGGAPDPGGPCRLDDGEVALRLTWPQGGSPEPVLVRLFERGEYHLADGALRYRRGGGGRQPLTPERLSRRSGFRARPGAVEVIVEIDGAGAEGRLAPFTWMVRPGRGATSSPAAAP